MDYIGCQCVECNRSISRGICPICENKLRLKLSDVADRLLAEKKSAEKRIAELEAENGRMEKFFLGACEKIGVEINFPYAGNPLEVVADHFYRASTRIAELEVELKDSNLSLQSQQVEIGQLKAKVTDLELTIIRALGMCAVEPGFDAWHISDYLEDALSSRKEG